MSKFALRRSAALLLQRAEANLGGSWSSAQSLRRGCRSAISPISSVAGTGSNALQGSAEPAVVPQVLQDIACFLSASVSSDARTNASRASSQEYW
jgi:hypothetical protein